MVGKPTRPGPKLKRLRTSVAPSEPRGRDFEELDVMLQTVECVDGPGDEGVCFGAWRAVGAAPRREGPLRGGENWGGTGD